MRGFSEVGLVLSLSSEVYLSGGGVRFALRAWGSVLWYGAGQVAASDRVFLGFLGGVGRTKGFSPLEYLGRCRIMLGEIWVIRGSLAGKQ